MKKKIEVNPEIKRKTLTFFLLFFPSLLMAIVPTTQLIWSILFKVLLLFYQFVVLKNFIDTHYGE